MRSQKGGPNRNLARDLGRMITRSLPLSLAEGFGKLASKRYTDPNGLNGVSKSALPGDRQTLDAGVASISVKATDAGKAFVTASFDITVLDINRAPVVTRPRQSRRSRAAAT